MNAFGLREPYFLNVGLITGVGSGFGATIPIPGTGRITELVYLAGLSDMTLASRVFFYLRWLDVIPTSSADMLLGEPVFPQVNVLGFGLYSMAMSSSVGRAVVTGPFNMQPRGRRLALQVNNVTANSIEAGLAIVWERCKGGREDPEAAC